MVSVKYFNMFKTRAGYDKNKKPTYTINKLFYIQSRVKIQLWF